MRTVASAHEFQTLLDIALAKLKDSPKDNKMQQVVVVQSLSEKIYSAMIPDVTKNEEMETDPFIAELSNACDTIIKKIVCVWRDGTMDLPSFQFRKKLYEKDERNGDAEILLKGSTSYIVRALKEVLV